MGDLYLEASFDDGVVVSFESAVCLFVYHHLKTPESVKIHFLNRSKLEGSLKIATGWLSYESLSDETPPTPVSLCSFPAFALNDGITCVAGLCSVLRQLVKSAGKEWAYLLGFRQSCLVACAEVSVWTKFCEVDVINLVKSILNKSNEGSESPNYLWDGLPVELARLEAHMAQPVRVHNVGKFKDKDHIYVEGPLFLLTDLMIALPLYIILSRFKCWDKESVPLVSEWMAKITAERSLEDQFSLFTLPSFLVYPTHPLRLPSVPKQSLYKRDPTRYKPRDKIFTQQVDIDASFFKLRSVEIFTYSEPLGIHTNLKDHFPLPEVPNSRRERKIQQLVNMTKATLEVAKPGDLIVDFCSGSGHLGLILAHCLPESTVVLLDNKEKSLDRARQRIKTINLNNIFIVQANLDYFIGRFQVGVSLHACGLASDLVIHKCLAHRANFVICPCCYGAIQSNHVITYPQSEQYKKAGLTEKGFVVLGHCADQEGCEQGERGMQAVDTDRCLLAENVGYKVILSKLIPPTCTTRNNLIIAKI